MDQIEFLRLTAPFSGKVFRLAKRLLISTEEAEDASQEVFVKLWRKKDHLLRFNNVEAFAMTITKNYCLDQLKSKRAENSKIVDGNYADETLNEDVKMEGRDSWSWVEKIINQLPIQQRLIVQMRDIEQYEFSEIAKIMEMNEIAVRVALSRARKTIRECMIKIDNYGIEKY